MIVTRIGKGSKMIICGDDNQVDLKQKRDSGFKFLYSASKKIKSLEAISLKQNHRDPIVEDLINLYNDAYEQGLSLGTSGSNGIQKDSNCSCIFQYLLIKNMAAGKYSFTIEQGATLNFELQYKDSAGLPISLRGYEGAMQIRSGYSASVGTVTYLTLTSSLGDVYAFNSASSFLSFSGSDLTTPVASGSIGIYSGWLATTRFNFYRFSLL